MRGTLTASQEPEARKKESIDRDQIRLLPLRVSVLSAPFAISVAHYLLVWFFPPIKYIFLKNTNSQFSVEFFPVVIVCNYFCFAGKVKIEVSERFSVFWN